MDLTPEHLDLLLQVANDATLGATFSERMDAVSESLLALITGSSLSLIVLDPRVPQAEVDAYLRNNDLRGAFEYAQHYVGDDPLPPKIMAAPGSPMRLSDHLLDGRWGRDSYTGEFLHRYGIQHLLGVAQPLPDGRVLQIAIHRGTHTEDFSPRELLLLKFATYDLGKAAFGALLREKLARSHGQVDQEARVGILVFTSEGYVEHADAGARGILRRLGDGFPMEELLGDARAVRALQEPLQRSLPVGEDVLLVRSRALERGSSASVMVVLELRAPMPTQEFAERVEPYRLTPRERDVAQQAVLGLTNQQIADELAISPVTVAVHLSRIFRKSGVCGRIELTRLLTGSPGAGG